jgi:hypothetical protein
MDPSSLVSFWDTFARLCFQTSTNSFTGKCRMRKYVAESEKVGKVNPSDGMCYVCIVYVVVT